jgi:hypothetical protein
MHQEADKTQSMLDIYEQLSTLLKLHQFGILSAAATSELYALIEARDTRVQAAFGAFKHDTDSRELVDSLLRIVMSKASQDENDDRNDGDDEEEDERDRADVNDSIRPVVGDDDNDDTDDNVEYVGQDAEHDDTTSPASSSSSSVISSWSELVRQLVGRVSADRQFSSESMMYLLKLIVNQDRILIGIDTRSRFVVVCFG